MSIIFNKPDKRTQWEQVFNEAKQKLGKFNANDLIMNSAPTAF